MTNYSETFKVTSLVDFEIFSHFGVISFPYTYLRTPKPRSRARTSQDSGLEYFKVPTANH